MKRRAAKSFNLNSGLLLYFFLIPSFLVIILTVCYPFVYNIIISFSNMSMSHMRDWHIIGVDNYAEVLSDKRLGYIAGKTFLWTGINLVFHVGFGFLLAMILAQRLPFHNFFRLTFILPWAVPQFISALTWNGLFQSQLGLINHLFGWVGLTPVNWFEHPSTSFAAACVANIWLGFPFMMVVFLASLQAIPKQYYDSAKVDGASAWQRLTKITLPLIKPAVMPVILLGFVWTFNNFNVIWLVTKGGRPYDSTHILVSYIFKKAFGPTREYGYGAAASVVLCLLLVAIGYGTVAYIHRLAKESR